MSEPLVYFATCADLALNYTKIGSCGNWVDRASTYKTSYPLHNIKPYCIIFTDRHTFVETIFLKEFKEFSSTKLKDYYEDGGTEWITKKPTIKEIKDVLNKHPKNISYNLLEDAELDEFLDDADGKVREKQAKRKEELEKEYEEYMLLHNKKKIPDLRGFQIEKFEIIKKMLQENDFNMILKLYIMCRCGKTILFQKIAFDYFDKIDMFVYVCPRLNLIKDMIERWQKVFPDVRLVELSSSKSDNCIPDDELKRICLKKEKVILFVCNDSFQRLTPLLNTDMRKMFVFDEAHYLARKKTDTHPLMLMKQNKGQTLTVFATATPVIGNYITNTDHIFMNDPEYFGEPRNTIKYNDIEDAIKNEFMTPANIVVGAYNLEDEERIENDVRSVKSVTMLWDLLNAKLEYKPNKILMYANSIKSVNAMFELLKKDKRFEDADIFKMTSKEDFKENANSLKKFEESTKLSILINCRMVTDGIDIEKLDVVVFIDPRYNKADLIQIISRPRSYFKGKIAYILIPQIYNFANDDFDTVINIIEELHLNNDPTVVKYISEIKKGNSNNTREQENPHFQIDEKVKAKILELTKERLLKKTPTLHQAIIKVLSDNQPRTAKQIWEEIDERKLWTPKTKTKSYRCGGTCGELFRRGKIGRQKVDNKFIYFIISKIKQHISTQEFCNMLLEDNILCQGDYYEYIGGAYDEIYVVSPETRYKDFSWDMLTFNNENPYNSLEEFREAINRLMLDNENYTFIKKIKNPDQRLTVLHFKDKRIRTDALTYFKKEKYSELHNVLKCYRTRKRF